MPAWKKRPITLTSGLSPTPPGFWLFRKLPTVDGVAADVKKWGWPKQGRTPPHDFKESPQ